MWNKNWYICPSSTLVDVKGSHGLSCKRSAGRSIRHHQPQLPDLASPTASSITWSGEPHRQLNYLIWPALRRASIPSVKEPACLSCSDGKRLDGLSLIPWQGGKCFTWGVTMVHTFAATCLATASTTAGRVAERAASKKDKYCYCAVSRFCSTRHRDPWPN